MAALRISRQTAAMLLLSAVCILLLVPAQQPGGMHILLPLVAAVWICGYSIARVWRKDGEIPLLDIGVLCVIFTTLYTVIPLLNFYFGGLEFGLLSDARLQQYRPEPEELGLFFGHHLAYLASLAFAYPFFRRSNRALPKVGVTPPRPLTVRALVLVFVALTLYFAILLYVFGIGFQSGYGESEVSSGPIWLAQINGKLSELLFIFEAAVVAYLVMRKNDARIRWFLFLLIAWNVFAAFATPGSRGELMSLLLLTFLFWHKFHGAPWRFTLIFLPVAFGAFMFLGLLRSFLDLDDLRMAMDASETIASATNEFQALLGTAYDVHKMVEGGIEVPPALAFNDVMPMLPPQQLWPFPKMAAADWYLIQIGQDGTGVGFMWGVVSQAVVGFGVLELMVRGVVLAWFLALIHRWYQRRYTRFLPTVFYVVLGVTTLWTFRDTTGAILWSIWWALLPFTAIFYLLGLRIEFARSTAGAQGERPDDVLSGLAQPRAGS